MNKHNLGFYKYHMFILIFLSSLSFFLCSVKHRKAMKIGFVFFRAIKQLLCISKHLPLFCSFSNPGKKALHAWLADWAERLMWRLRGTHVEADSASTWHQLKIIRPVGSGPLDLDRTM